MKPSARPRTSKASADQALLRQAKKLRDAHRARMDRIHLVGERLHRDLFENTGNPLYVWLSWRACRKSNKPPPDWVSEALDSFADRLLELAEVPPKERVCELAGAAIGFSTGKKGGNPFMNFHRIVKSGTVLASYVEARRSGKTKNAAFALIESEGFSISTARRLLADACKVKGWTIQELDRRFGIVEGKPWEDPGGDTISDILRVLE